MHHVLRPGLIAALLALVVSCAKPPQDNMPRPSKSRRATTKTPDADPDDQLVNRVLAAYRKGAYSDRAELTLTYQFRDNRRDTSTTVYRTWFKAPNLLSLHLANVDNELAIWCDGERLVSQVIDPPTANFDGQLAVSEAPEKLTLADLYRVTELVDPLRPGELMSVLMAAPAGLELTPLSLLLNEGRLLEILRAARVLPARPEEELLRLEATAQEGTFKLFVDPTSLLVRRMDFPATTANLPANIESVRLRAEFLDASSVASRRTPRLQKKLQHATREVTRFVLPPVAPATALLGASIGGLRFVDASGNEVAVNDRASTIRVLVWFSDHPASRAAVEQIDKLQQHVGPDEVSILAIGVDQEQTDAALLLSQWRTSLNGYSDPRATGRDNLGITQAPTTVLLGRDGRLHYFAVGASRYLTENLSAVIEKLQRGDDVGQATIDQHNLALAAYERQLSMVTPGDTHAAPPNPTLHAPAGPELLHVKRLWATNEIPKPGNMLLIPGSEPTVFVLDGWNQLCQLNCKGEMISRFHLDLPSHEGVSFLRGGVDEQGNVIVAAAARGGHRAYVFETNGKRRMQYPEAAESTMTLSDLVVADLDGNQTPELYLGCQGEAGVYGLGLDGGRVWSNRAMLGVTSLALAATESAASTDLIVAGQSGLLALVDRHGRTRRQLTVGDRPLHQIATWPGTMRQLSSFLSSGTKPNSAHATMCGFSFSAVGDPAVVGINASFEIVWEHALSLAVFQHQVDLPQTMTVGDRPFWLIPAGDGSVSFVSADGRTVDRLYTGQHLRGIGAFQDDGQSILILATDDAVSGYIVSLEE